MMGSCYLSKVEKILSSCSATANNRHNGIFKTLKLGVFQPEYFSTMSLQHLERFGTNGLTDSVLERSLVYRYKGSFFQSKRCFGHDVRGDAQLNRDFLVQLWISDRRRQSSREKRRKVVRYKNIDESIYDPRPFGRWFSGATVTEEKPLDKGKQILGQPPVSQTISGFLEPASLEEVQVAPLLARSNLLITRDIEWANLVLGFEQVTFFSLSHPYFRFEMSLKCYSCSFRAKYL